MTARRFFLVAAFFFLSPAGAAVPVGGVQDAVEEAIERGVKYLRGRIQSDPWWGAEPAEVRPAAKRPGRARGAPRKGGERVPYVMGKTAIELYALLASEVPVDDPLVRRGFEFLAGLRPRNVYCTALYILALDAALGQIETDEALKGRTAAKRTPDAKAQGLKSRLAELARWMVSARLEGRGAWNYTDDHSRSQGRYDNSNTQFAVLALGVAAKRGVAIPEAVWSEIAKHFLDDQETDGRPAREFLDWPPGRSPGKTAVGGSEIRCRGWPYQSGGRSTINMTAAGLSSLMIAREYLGRAEKLPDDERARIDRAIRDGLSYLAGTGLAYGKRHLYYGLYSVEKVGDLGSLETIGPIDWYAQGVDLLLRKQREDGSWGEPDEPQEHDFRHQTSFALLFLNRATDLFGPARPIFTHKASSGAQGGDRLFVSKLGGEVSLSRLFRKLKYRLEPDLLPVAEAVVAEAEKQRRLADLVLPALGLLDSESPRLRELARRCLERATGEKHKDPARYREWLAAWRLATRAGTEEDRSRVGDLKKLLVETGSPPLKLQIVWALERLRAREALPELISELETSRSAAYQERVHRAMQFISGADLPFDPKASAATRAEQIQRWKRWVESEGSGKTSLRAAWPRSSLLVLAALIGEPGQKTASAMSSVEIDGETYGAQPNDAGPIGGGAGYGRIATGGDFVVEDLDGLLAALAKAKPGQSVFIPGETEIDCTARVYIERLVIEVPGGVTLAGNRGAGGSLGALIASDALDTPVLIRATGPGVRITGLRIRGPNPKRYLDHHKRSFAEGRGHEYYYKFPTSDGIVTEHPKLEVDNCEISGFGHAGVYLKKGNGHWIHHSSIHHCQYAGLGYGIAHGEASSVIERNLFDWNRHSIAGTGVPGCGYEAKHNIQGPNSLSHCFDMHGGRDRKDGTEIAGTRILIHHNTFQAPETPIVIRGLPEETCAVHHNWFVRHSSVGSAVKASGNVRIEANAYGAEQPKVIR